MRGWRFAWTAGLLLAACASPDPEPAGGDAGRGAAARPTDVHRGSGSPDAAVRPMALDAASGSLAPHLTRGADDRLYLSWIEPATPEEKRRFRSDEPFFFFDTEGTRRERQLVLTLDIESELRSGDPARVEHRLHWRVAEGGVVHTEDTVTDEHDPDDQDTTRRDTVIVYEDEHTLAFMDINPLNPGHALAIPKEHAETIHQISEASLAATAATAKRVAAAIEAELAPDGINLMQANGPGAAQSVPHFHLHIIPRHTGDELKMNESLTPGDMDAIGQLAEAIRARV